MATADVNIDHLIETLGPLYLPNGVPVSVSPAAPEVAGAKPIASVAAALAHSSAAAKIYRAATKDDVAAVIANSTWSGLINSINVALKQQAIADATAAFVPVS